MNIRVSLVLAFSSTSKSRGFYQVFANVGYVVSVMFDLQENIFEWQFAIRGPSETEFEGGIYHGRIQLPSEYPFKPPSFMLLTVILRFYGLISIWGYLFRKLFLVPLCLLIGFVVVILAEWTV